MIAGNDTSTSRTGLGDPAFKLSFNFIGSPALTMSEFRSYRQSTVAGVSLAVTAPMGQYYPDKLINLGTNRWSFSSRLGASQIVGRWLFEGFARATFYTANEDYFGGVRSSRIRSMTSRPTRLAWCAERICGPADPSATPGAAAPRSTACRRAISRTSAFRRAARASRARACAEVRVHQRIEDGPGHGFRHVPDRLSIRLGREAVIGVTYRGSMRHRGAPRDCAR